MVCAIILSVVGLIFQNTILALMNTPEEAFAGAVGYSTISMAGLVFVYGYNMVSAILRGMGDAKSPFLFIGIASVLNLVLDILFTGIWGWGVAGAAWATIIGQAVSFLFSIWYLYKKREAI